MPHCRRRLNFESAVPLPQGSLLKKDESAAPVLQVHQRSFTNKTVPVEQTTQRGEKRKEPDNSDDSSTDEEPEFIKTKRFKYYYPIALEAWIKNWDKYDKEEEKQKKKYGENYGKIRAHTNTSMVKENRRAFFDVYKDFLVKDLFLRNSKIHQKIRDQAIQLHECNIPAKAAAKEAVKKYGYEIDAAKFVENVGEDNDSDLQDTDSEYSTKYEDDQPSEDEKDSDKASEEEEENSGSDEEDDDSGKDEL